ncbi:MAG: hypothetical protein ACREUF_05815, partial [Solimonas sp.]
VRNRVEAAMLSRAGARRGVVAPPVADAARKDDAADTAGTIARLAGLKVGSPPRRNGRAPGG